jgi:predicted unusual protein kinase regulating ubiquinone biosynthesis (AarF/ABC1/UbiB family)
MTDDDREDRVRALAELLLGGPSAEVPTSTLGRLGRTARAAMRIGRLTLAKRTLDEDGIVAMANVDPATVERLVRNLGELKGIAMKMGQILSYIDDSLPDETRRVLSLLQTTSQPTAFEEIERTVRAELGERAGELLATMERVPAASASIGQVHRARLPDGTKVAVKVKHPGIAEAILADFRAATVGPIFAQILGAGLSVRELIDEAKARFLEECDYELEARRQRQFATIRPAAPVIVVPEVHEAYSSRSVLTTTWHQGITFEEFVDGARSPTAEERDRAGRALYEFYIGALYRNGLFNADPHPGNLVFEPAGERRIVVLDYGCVREFDRPTVRALAEMSRAVRGGDAQAVRRAVVRLGARDPGASGAALETTHALLRGFYAPVLEPGRHRIAAGVAAEAREVARTKLAIARLRLPGKLLFLFRIRFGLYAVLSRLGAQLDWRALEAELADAALAAA